MKKVLFKLFLSIAICSFGVAVYAETMQVMSLSDFTTENPSEYIEVQIYNDIQLDEDLSLRSGYQVKGKVVDVVSPKRLKRDAKFSIIPVSYKDFSGVEHPIEKEHVGKYSPKFDIDKGQLAKDAALAVGNHFVKGLSLGYHAVEGAVKNEEGNRLKSSVVSIYESTPLSYANNGEEIVIDIKGCPDSEAKLKRKMFWYVYPNIKYDWIGYSKIDGGWVLYETILQGRKSRKKVKRN